MPESSRLTESPLSTGSQIDGEFQVLQPYSAIGRSGSRFVTCLLDDGSQRLRAYAWESDCEGFHIPRHGDRIRVAGTMRHRKARWELLCQSLAIENTEQRIVWAKTRLRAVLQGIQPNELRRFLLRVFQDSAIAPAFQTAPASLNHHHAYPGGLMVHSAEVAWTVYQWLRDDPSHGVATAAALLHDIAKTRTLTKAMHRTPLGQRVDHDDLTLEVLAPHLNWLDTQNPQTAIALRHLLTWKPRRSNPSPGLAALELIRAADRISARFAPAPRGNRPITIP